VLVAGAGAWGTALACVLARHGKPTLLWGRCAESQRRLGAERGNARYLPGVAFPATLQPITALRQAAGVRRVVLAVPCNALRETLERLRDALGPSLHLCLACKGMERSSRKLGHAIVRECLAGAVPSVLSGPSFAAEVGRGLPTAVVLAATDLQEARAFAALFHEDHFRVYVHDDVLGVELAGAVKNVMAVAAGAADGLGLGANARAALITRQLAELMRLGEALGARRETFTGLAGVGDLILTCTDDQSRNRRLGMALARGETVAAAAAGIGATLEGLHSAQAVHRLALEHGVEMPVVEQVARVLAGETTPPQALRALLRRPLREEFYGMTPP